MFLSGLNHLALFLFSYPDEAEVDHAAEITTEKAEEIAANQDDEEEMYSNLPANSSKKKEEVTE